MNINVKKFWNDYGIGALIILLIIAYGANLFYVYLNSKSGYGSEMMTSTPNTAYSTQPNYNNSIVQPSNPDGSNEVFQSVDGIQTSMPGIPASCSPSLSQNPDDLLPKDTNSQWAQLNPSGKGELSNINLLKAGYHVGIDTIGQSLRNANLQIRSEPPNPQVYVGPWNQSTIEPDFMRPPLEIGAGTP
jgi:hypothetical protein